MNVTFFLKPCVASMKFADRVERDRDTFTFRDRTGHIHGEFKKGDPVCSAPENAVGAALVEGHWHWVLAL